MCKVIFISYLFAPLARAAGVNRAHLVKYLAEAGWSVDVITGERYRSLFLVFQKDPRLLEILPAEVKIHRFDSLSGWFWRDLVTVGREIFGKPAPIRRAWIEDAVSNYQPDSNSVVVAVLSTVENAVLAYRLAEKHDLPMVLHFVDDTRGVDERIIARASLLCAVTEQIRDNLYARYGHPNIEIVRNGYTEEIEVATEKDVCEPVKIVYAGSFAYSMRPEFLLKAYSLVRRRKPDVANKIQIVFYGHKGGYYYNLHLRHYACDRVRFMGYLNIGELRKALQEYHIGFVSAARDVSFSSKAYSYLNAGLPIFAASNHSGLRDFVTKHNIGVTSRLEVEELAERLEYLVMHREFIQEWRNNVLEVRREFSMQEQVNHLSDMLKSLIR